MLHHLGALRLDTNDFDKTLIEALACYRSVRDKNEEKQYSVGSYENFHYMLVLNSDWEQRFKYL